MSNFGNAFKYDVVLSLTSSPSLPDCIPFVESTYGARAMLAVTYNHRFYNIREKNFIKNFADIHALDHLMFSARPSSKDLLATCPALEIQRYRDIAQVICVLQVMGRYDVPSAIIDTTCLATFESPTVRVVDIEPQIRGFLDKLREAFPRVANIRKQFPMLFSIEKILPSIQQRELALIHAMPRELPSQAHDYATQQITELEKSLFWLGFDPAFKEVPHDKAYPVTKWTAMATTSQVGMGLYEGELRYCSRCCLPETMEGIELDDLGICIPCRSSEEKMHIDWEAKQKALERIVNSYRKEDYYDCMLPMSGGKDSTYQAHILEHIIKVTPLAVTHGHNWHSLEGRYNLENCLQQFDLDHLFFVKGRTVINKMARKSLGAIGDVCWHCHIGAGTFPIHSAIAWNVELMCWGEGIAEADGRGGYFKETEASLLYNLEISARITAEDMVDEVTSESELSAWIYPPGEVLKASSVRYIHLGNYFFWDEERQVEFIKRNYEWMDSRVENTYKGYKSVECVMAGLHDYANFIKRGIGRATIHASEDVRRGLMTREEGMELAKKFDTQRPHALDYYLAITGFSERQFEDTLVEARTKSDYAIKLSHKAGPESSESDPNNK